MIRFFLSFLGGIFTFITIGMVMAVLGVSIIFWIYGRDLPDHEQLAQYTPATISRIYSAEGQLIDEFARERRLYTPIEEIPDVVANAFISAEDKNFYTHRGFDLRGIASAVVEAAQGGRLRGASTIPQQVAKNEFLGGERTIERKIQEILLANRMIRTLGREHVLEIYLNSIFLGQNSYGVTAAALTYFNKSLDELTPEEAAYLAALPKAPSNYHPVREQERAVTRRNYVLSEMHDNGYLDTAAYEQAASAPLLTVQAGDFPAFRQSLPPRDYFSDEIRRQLSRDFGEDDFFTAGYTVRATVDPQLQPVAAASLRRALEEYDRNLGVWRGTGETIDVGQLGSEEEWRAALRDVSVSRDVEGWHPAVVLEVGSTHARIGIEGVADDADGHWIPPEDVTWARKRLSDGSLANRARTADDLLDVGEVVLVRQMTRDSDGSFMRWTLRQVPEVQGGFVAMDVHTGRVLAMQGGFSYQNSVFNRATQASRQPGSSFKPFVYAAALDSGFTPATIVIDAPIEVDTGAGIWRPQNASHQFYGPTPLRTGIERSRNLMTIRLAQEIGMDVVASYAERFGVYDRMNPYLSNSLGAEETTLYRMVTSYAMFANGGERIEPTLVDRVQSRTGETIYRHDQRRCSDCEQGQLLDGYGPRITSNRERVMNAITAYQLTSMMRGVVERGTASRTVNLPVPVAGKTGTTNDARDVWFIGFTSNIVAGCYIGYDRPQPLGRGASGGGMCGPVFNRFMLEAIEEYGGGDFAVPPGGRFIRIDRFSGSRLPDDARGENVVAEYFREGEEPIFGLAGMIDGGFTMGANLPLFAESESAQQGQTVTTSDGGTARVAPRANSLSLSSGGLY